MKRRAATRALRPVSGAVGSNRLGSAALEEDEELPLPLVEEGFADSGLALPVIQVLTPLMMPLSCAVVKSSQMAALVLVVWTLEPPRTSPMAGRVTLRMLE
jgi:hypothetical protein